MKNFKVGLMVGLLFVGQGLIASDRSFASKINEGVDSVISAPLPVLSHVFDAGRFASLGAVNGFTATFAPAVSIGCAAGNLSLSSKIMKSGTIIGASSGVFQYVQSQDTSEEVKAALSLLIAQAGCTGLGMVAGLNTQTSAGGCAALVAVLTAAAALQN